MIANPHTQHRRVPDSYRQNHMKPHAMSCMHENLHHNSQLANATATPNVLLQTPRYHHAVNHVHFEHVTST